MKKQPYNFTFGLVFGLLIAGVFYWLGSNQNDVPKFKFVPTYKGYHKDMYVQMVETQEQVDRIKKSNIRDARMADIGSVLKLGRTGLNLVPSEEVSSVFYHLKPKAPIKNLAQTVGGFPFQPNAVLSIDPIELALITTSVELESAKQSKLINNRDLLEIGSAVVCPSKQCFVTGKATLETEYSKMLPIASSSEKDNQTIA